MAVTVRIGRSTVTIQGYVWRGEDKLLVDHLNARLHPMGPSGADPYPDLTAAREAVSALGGRITKKGRVPKVQPGLVY